MCLFAKHSLNSSYVPGTIQSRMQGAQNLFISVEVPVYSKPTGVSQYYKAVGKDALVALPYPGTHTTPSTFGCLHTGLNGVNNSAAY